MNGYCECGCGGKTSIAIQSNKKIGHIKGKPVRFIVGHQGNLHRYRGGRAKHTLGYEMILKKGHPRADNRGYVPNSILIMESILGKYLPIKSIVHHIDGDKTNDDKSNFVVCENRAYHNLLHRREKALKACGHASWRKCTICKNYDDPNNLVINKRQPNGSQKIYHKNCRKLYRTHGILVPGVKYS